MVIQTLFHSYAKVKSHVHMLASAKAQTNKQHIINKSHKQRHI